MLATAVGRAVIRARKSKGLAQTELAQKAGCSKGHLSRIEAGLVNLPLEMLQALSGALGLLPSKLLAKAEALMEPPGSRGSSAPLPAPPHAESRRRLRNMQPPSSVS